MEHEQAILHFSSAYAKARKEHPALPPLEAIDAEWDILETVSRERHFPRNAVMYVRWFMMRAINGWASYLHEFILPSPQSAVSMEEYNYFDESEKQRIVAILNWIMYCNRESNLLQLDEDDAKSAAFIEHAWNDWRTHKPALREILQKNTDIWRKKLL